jgi:phosphatidylserine synthase
MIKGPVHDLHASNLLTYGSLLAAISAIAAARGGSVSLAGALLATATIFDTFDGRFARRFARQSRIGSELDSLVDALAFGLTPVVVLESLSRPSGPLGIAWWAGAFVYVLAAVTRLALYNVQESDKVFVGLPTPAAGLIWSTCLLWPSPPWLVAPLLVAVGTAMMWPFTFPRPRGVGLAAFALWAAALVVLHTLRLAG